jgi:hypothetical protein
MAGLFHETALTALNGKERFASGVHFPDIVIPLVASGAERSFFHLEVAALFFDFAVDSHFAFRYRHLNVFDIDYFDFTGHSGRHLLSYRTAAIHHHLTVVRRELKFDLRVGSYLNATERAEIDCHISVRLGFYHASAPNRRARLRRLAVDRRVA